MNSIIVTKARAEARYLQLAEGGGIVVPPLTSMGVTLDKVRQGILELLDQAPQDAPLSKEVLDEVVKQALFTIQGERKAEIEGVTISPITNEQIETVVGGWRAFTLILKVLQAYGGDKNAPSERERCALHLDDMTARAESPAIKAAYKLAAQQIRALD